MVRLGLLALVASSCASKCAGTAPAAADSGAPPTELAAAPSREQDDDQPVYPFTRDAPDPVAQRYCDLVYERAELARKACCPKTPFTPFLPTGECVRTLSAALKSAAVSVAAEALDGCEAAVSAEAKQCDWGGELPAPCLGVVRGRVGEGAVCRSALECAGGRQCAGLGTSKPGRCSAAATAGQLCLSAPDTLGSFVHQETETSHPSCEGFCKLQRCFATVPLGGPCTSMLECGAQRRCHRGKCTDTEAPAQGERCTDAACAFGLRCVAGTCRAPKRLDEACAADDECRGGYCEGGRCALSCDVIRRKAPTPR